MSLKLTKYDVDFLTNTWQGPKGAAYNVIGEECFQEGLYYEQLSLNAGRIIMTPEGADAVRYYYEKKWRDEIEERNTERKAGNGSTEYPLADV